MLSLEAKELARELLRLPWEDGQKTIESLAKQRKPEIDKALLEMLEHRNVWLRERILDSLWEFGAKGTARKAALIGIKAKNFSVRDTAAEMLEQVGTKGDVPALIHVLRTDKQWVARASAASSLGELRTRAGITALKIAIANDRYCSVRDHAAQALCRTGEKKYTPFIEERILHERDAAVLPALYSAMEMMGRAEYVEKIIDLLYEPQHWWMVYLRACVMLEGIFIAEGKPLPDRAILGLKRVMKYDVGKAAKWAARDLLKKVGITVREPAVS
jgi:HEAT repeat protein